MLEHYTIINNSILDKDIILYPNEHQSAVEAYLNVPLPDAEPLSTTQKVLFLLEEIKRINYNLAYFSLKNNQNKLEELQKMKENFTTVLHDIMVVQFQISFFQTAKAA